MKPTFYVPVGKVISFREKPQTPKMHTKWGVIAIEALDGEAYTFQLFGDMFLFFMNNGSVGDYVTISGIIRDFKYRDWETDRKSTRLNSSHRSLSRMPSSA